MLYRLSAHEKLVDIAHAHGTTTNAICAANPHKHAVELPGVGAVFLEMRAGEEIQVPGVGRPPSIQVQPVKTLGQQILESPFGYMITVDGMKGAALLLDGTYAAVGGTWHVFPSKNRKTLFASRKGWPVHALAALLDPLAFFSNYGDGGGGGGGVPKEQHLYVANFTAPDPGDMQGINIFGSGQSLVDQGMIVKAWPASNPNLGTKSGRG